MLFSSLHVKRGRPGDVDLARISENDGVGVLIILIFNRFISYVRTSEERLVYRWHEHLQFRIKVFS